MSRKRDRKFNKWASAQLNTATFWIWYERLKNIALSRFEWIGLPASVDERFLELMLFDRGYCLYFHDDAVDMDFCLPCALDGKWNLYNIPVKRRAWANNGYQAERTNMDSVLIYDNLLHTTLEETCLMFAGRLYEIERSIDVNVKAQKTPVLVLANENQRLSMKNLYMQYEGNEPFIFGDKQLNPEDIQVLTTGAPYVAGNMQTLKHQYFNEWLSFLGIENANEDKKERLVSQEVGANYGLIERTRNVALITRRKAAAQINAMFGTNIQVEFRSELKTLVNEAFKPDVGGSMDFSSSNAGLGGEEDVEIYNRDSVGGGAL